MSYAILIILFVARFAFLFWSILMGTPPQHPLKPDATYVCPVCNENQCQCRMVDDPE